MILDKICQSCGRTIEWRKKWENCWEEVSYCSKRCRKSKPTQIDRKLEQAILELLDLRSPKGTICPSEATRHVLKKNQWRDHMEQVRQAARRLVSSGQIEILQKGRVVDPSKAKGPIRLRKKQQPNFP